MIKRKISPATNNQQSKLENDKRTNTMKIVTVLTKWMKFPAQNQQKKSNYDNIWLSIFFFLFFLNFKSQLKQWNQSARADTHTSC